MIQAGLPAGEHYEEHRYVAIVRGGPSRRRHRLLDTNQHRAGRPEASGHVLRRPCTDLSAVLSETTTRSGRRPPTLAGGIIILVNTLILALWYAAIAAKAAAAYRLYRDGLITRFAPLWVYLVVCTVRSVTLLAFQDDLERYKQIFTYSMPLVSLLEGFAVAGVFWAVAEQYPRFRKPGSVILSCLAGIGACAVWLTHFVAVPAEWSAPWQMASLLERHSMLAMTIVLAGTRFFLPRIPGIPIRPSAKRAADILCLNTTVSFIATSVMIGSDGQSSFSQLLKVGGGLLSMSALALFVTKASDRSADVRPVTALDEAEMIRAERWFERLTEAASNQTR